jgi:adenosylhomocysteine nucleosidase
VNIGFITALPAEARCLAHKTISPNLPVRLNNYITLIICGIGPVSAMHAAELMLFHKVDGLISWGTAGALIDDIRSGDLILPDSIQTERGDKGKVDAVLHNRIRQKIGSTFTSVHTGVLAETRTILETPEQKTALHRKTGAIAADMESGAIMKVARENNLPFVAVRSVVDEAREGIPAEFSRHTDIFGTPDITGLMTEFLCKPELVIYSYRLFIAMRAALSTLRKIAANLDESVLQPVS